MDYKYTYKTNRAYGICFILKYNIGEYNALEHGYKMDYELSLDYEFPGGAQPIYIVIKDNIVVRGTSSTTYNKIISTNGVTVSLEDGEESYIDSGSAYIKCGKEHGDISLYITAPYNSSNNYKLPFKPEFEIEATGSNFYIEFKAPISLKNVPVSGVVPVEAPDFNDNTDELTISYKMPLRYGTSSTGLYYTEIEKIEAGIAFGSDVVPATEEVTVAYREITNFTSSNHTKTKTYTFTLTNDEKTKLLQDAPFVVSQARFYIKTTLEDGNIAYHYLARNFTVTDATPTIAPTVKDVNAATIALTGNENTIVRYMSDAYYTTGAEAYKEAKIANTLVTNGSQAARENFTGTITGADSNVFVFSVTDTRGANSDLVTVEKGFVEYVKLTCNQEIKVVLEGESGAKASVVIYGNYFNGNFGAVKNELTLQIRYTQNDGTMSEWQTLHELLEPSFEGGTYTVDFEMSGFDSKSAYDFQCRAFDKLNSAETSIYTARLIPVFDWGENDFNVNKPTTLQDTLDVAGNVSTGGNLEVAGNVTATGSLEVGGAVTANGYTFLAPYILSDTYSEGIVELADNLANYQYIEIFFTDNNDRGCGYTKIPIIDDSAFTIDLFLVEASNKAATYIRRTGYICSGNKLSPNESFAGYVLLNSSGITHSNDETNYITVTRVVGWR